MTRRRDGSRPEVVYLNGILLAESTERHPARDYHWTADEGGTVELEGLESSEGDVLVVLSEPVQGATRATFQWSGTRWVDPDRGAEEVLAELPGVEKVFVLDDDREPLEDWSPVTVLVRADEDLDADSLEAVENDVVRELRAVFGVSVEKVLVLPAGDAGDFVEAKWRLG